MCRHSSANVSNHVIPGESHKLPAESPRAANRPEVLPLLRALQYITRSIPGFNPVVSLLTSAWITRDWVMTDGLQFLPDISRRSQTTPFTPPAVVRFAGPRAGPR